MTVAVAVAVLLRQVVRERGPEGDAHSTASGGQRASWPQGAHPWWAWGGPQSAGAWEGGRPPSLALPPSRRGIAGLLCHLLPRHRPQTLRLPRPGPPVCQGV